MDSNSTPKLAQTDAHGLRQLVSRELTHTVQSLAGIRFGGFALLCLLTILFGVFEGASFKFWLLLAVLAASLGIVMRRPRLQATDRNLIAIFATIFAFQTTIILVTGGIESPFVVLYVPVVVIMAVGIGDRRLFARMVLLPMAAVWLFAGLRVSGVVPTLLPAVLRDAGEHFTPVFWLTFAGVMTGVMMLGGFFGLQVRAALDRAVHGAAEARAETLVVSQERNAELIELLGALAHELKNPLACIQGLSGLVARKLPAGEKPAEQMAVVNEEIKRMGAILEEFLTFSRPLQELNLEDVVPLTLARDVVTMHEAEALRRRIALESQGAGDLLVLGDGRKLKQVLVNLVQNALDAAPDGGHVTLSAAALDGERVELVVDDDGAGFGAGPARFFTPGLTTKSAGSGLGLTIARVIVEQHGGSLVLGDREGGGGRVRVMLPRRGPQSVLSVEERPE